MRTPFHTPLPWWHAVLLAAAILVCRAPAVRAATNETGPRLLAARGKVEVARANSNAWTPAQEQQALATGDRVRTGDNSSALVRLTDLSIWQMSDLSTVEIQAPTQPQSKASLFVERGLGYFFGRDRRETIDVKTRLATGAIRGTEFNLAVDANSGATVLTMFEGEVEFSAAGQSIVLTNREQGTAQPNQAPTKTAVLDTVNVIQWSLYYPGVLDVAELPFTADEQQALAPSIAGYRSGDLLAALTSYPANRTPASAAEKAYFAALLLGVGKVPPAEAALSSAGDSTQAHALRRLIAAVKFQSDDSAVETNSATALVAASYYEQSRAQLEPALRNARRATELSPQFGFAWVRLAELEFSFGHSAAARRALERGLELSPGNAQAHALRGFVLAAENHWREAVASFARAIALDHRLANAWLGRGLCRIRGGDRPAGLEDLEAAAALEPNRAVLRSYLGKAFSATSDEPRAAHELDIARQLDPNDPTAWLYSALLNQQRNRINEAARDLERAQATGGNRRVYRSQFLLDQDRAVRSANLAAIYRDAGMIEVSAREASKGVQSDYGNYSAHLFLANSFDQLRDPKQINLRYETAWLSEYLIANLLAPVGAGSLSPTISEQEYSRFFEGNYLGVASSTEYFSSGDWVQNGSQFGRYDNVSYAVEANYRTENGQRRNNDQEQTTLSFQLKQQLTPLDSLFVQVIAYDFESGDLTQYYRQTNANPALRVKEEQEPLLIAGYHHEWAPGHHTIFLAGRLSDELDVLDPRLQSLPGLVVSNRFTPQGAIRLPLDYSSELEIYTAELQQIGQIQDHGVILGGRYQNGFFETRSHQTDPGRTIYFPANGVAANQNFDNDFQRLSCYAYDNWRVLDSLLLTAGVSYDWLKFPDNFRNAPISGGEETRDRLSPKAGLFWNATSNTTWRASYTRSLGGVSFDQSFRLEPTQIGGFNQSFRSIIPESVAGAAAAPTLDVAGVGLDQRLGRSTYLGVEATALDSEVRRSVGAFKARLFASTPFPLREKLDYEERTLAVNLNQLLGDEWAAGARYRLSEAELDDRFPQIPRGRRETSALLHQLTLFVFFHHSSGLFAQAEAVWTAQHNDPGATMPGDDFWQCHAFVGYRFPKRRAEIRVGLLNLSDQDYRLNPLNLYAELPRERTFTASLKFHF